MVRVAGVVEVPPPSIYSTRGGFRVRDKRRDYDDAVETVAADRS